MMTGAGGVFMFKPFRVVRKRIRRLRGRGANLMRAVRLLLATPHRLAELAAELDEHRRETRILYTALARRRADDLANPPLIPGGPGQNVLTRSIPCRQDSFAEPWFSYWTSRFHATLRHHRKLWEFVFICQALWERGALRPGARGLGFGVGTEPLAALFAADGCRIVGTDMAPDSAQALGWIETQQHALGKEALRHSYICPDPIFDENVAFRVCDMNHVPADLTGFDFCWSSCALEHLGSIEHGLAFIERSLDCLKPGGWAMHTTELNLSSDDATVDHMSTVLFRRRDFEELKRRLEAKGHHIAPLDFDPGSGPADTYIDVPPYLQEPCLKIALMGYVTTSFGVIIQKSG
jgi:2-polyprenyl-3-methyl-5-hydroxy-6-metoxy-1,4-benzoquinol methylase